MKTIIANAVFTFQIPDERTLPQNVYVHADKDKVELRKSLLGGYEVIATIGQNAVAWTEVKDDSTYFPCTTK